LGLATEDDRQQIPVKYSAPLVEVYADVVTHLLNKGERCDSIFHIWPRGEGIELPLTTQENIDPGLHTWMPKISRRLRVDLPKLAGFGACKDTRVTYEIDTSTYHLRMDAVSCGTVQRCWPGPSYRVLTTSRLLLLLLWLRNDSIK
jgi:hypothetical protein